MEEELGGGGGEWMHVHGWVPSLSTWSYHNTVNQLYSNTKYKVLKKKKWAQKAQPQSPEMVLRAGQDTMSAKWETDFPAGGHHLWQKIWGWS